MQEIMDMLGFIKIKNFCSAKDCVKRMIRQATDHEKIFAKDTSDEILLSKIYKGPLKLNDKKTNNPIKYGPKILNRHITKEDIQVTNKHTKKCFTSMLSG